METTGVWPALQKGVIETIRNEGQRRRREESHGEWGMEAGQRGGGYLVLGEEGQPEREEIGRDEWMATRRWPGEAKEAGEG